MTPASPHPPARSDRAEERRAFLKSAGWIEADAAPLAGDASTRSYERLLLGSRRAVLMNAPPAAEGAACPPAATPEQRRRLGYNAMARLAGPNLNAFLAVASALRSAGLSAPDVFHADAATGFALIEDLGDALYARAIPEGADEADLYGAAIDALLALRRARLAPPTAPGYQMMSYDRTALEAETMLVPDWYWRLKKNAEPDESVRAEYRAAWAGVLDLLPPPETLVLRDFHAENVLWLPERRGPARAGLIDFQDGLFGLSAYDLVSILEDARRDVSPSLAAAMIARFEAGAAADGAFDSAGFRRDYAILGAQRNAKILGIFARLVLRDGKPRYLDFLPRVEAHFRGDLRHGELAPLADFFRRRFPDLVA